VKQVNQCAACPTDCSSSIADNFTATINQDEKPEKK
jgi:hypothetical protein